jgi:glutathione S-transferase
VHPVSLKLYFHPFSSYCQKALIALYENAIAFEPRVLDGPDSPALRELAALWPMKRFPVLVDGDRTIIEASCIVEYLGLHHPGPVRLIPDDARAALEVRTMDRFFDNYVSTPQQKIVFDALRPEGSRDAYGVAQAREMLDTAYGWLDACDRRPPPARRRLPPPAAAAPIIRAGSGRGAAVPRVLSARRA